MKKRLEALIREWESKERQEWEYRAKGFNEALLMCMEDLQDAILLDEAEKVAVSKPSP